VDVDKPMYRIVNNLFFLCFQHRNGVCLKIGKNLRLVKMQMLDKTLRLLIKKPAIAGFTLKYLNG